VNGVIRGTYCARPGTPRAAATRQSALMLLHAAASCAARPSEFAAVRTDRSCEQVVSARGSAAAGSRAATRRAHCSYPR